MQIITLPNLKPNFNLKFEFTNKDGKVIEGENVWVPGPNTVPINPSTPPENKDFSAY